MTIASLHEEPPARRSGPALALQMKAYVPPISVVLARDKERYIRGLTAYRDDRVLEWIEIFSVAATEASKLAEGYLAGVTALQEEWRSRLREKVNPRSDAAAWALIEVLPGHPVMTLPVGVAARGKSKPAVNGALADLATAEVLRPLSESQRNRAWEATELLDLIVDLEEGVAPSDR